MHGSRTSSSLESYPLRDSLHQNETPPSVEKFIVALPVLQEEWVCYTLLIPLFPIQLLMLDVAQEETHPCS